MTTRYTYPNLDRDCLALNSTLEHLGSDYRLVVGSSYGYSTVDLATLSQFVVHCCERRLVSGSPREGIAAARQFVRGTSQESFHREAGLRAALESVLDLPADDCGERVIPAGFLNSARKLLAD